MNAKIQKWGNSLGIRIPKNYLKEVNLHENESVDILVQGDNIVIMPKRKPQYDLEELLLLANKKNLHHEDPSEPVGNEVW